MRIRRSLFSIGAALAVVAVGLGAGPAKSGSGDIKVDSAWVRESPIGGDSGGGYMRIVNTGKEADRLLGAESPVAKSIVLKQMTYVGDTLQTRELPNGIEIGPGQSVLMRWEAYHLLFVGLKEPFKRDGAFEASLNFEKAGQVTVRFEVRPRVQW
jgi:periplasmic copper chaperone A